MQAANAPCLTYKSFEFAGSNPVPCTQRLQIEVPSLLFNINLPYLLTSQWKIGRVRLIAFALKANVTVHSGTGGSNPSSSAKSRPTGTALDIYKEYYE
jgi:hypothetical protein